MNGKVYTPGREPIEVARINFTRKTPQVWHDSWRNTDRTCRYYGDCVGCGRRCYGFDDGENDPRGILGDHAVSMFHADDYNSDGKDVVGCFLCQNDYDSYQWALEQAKRVGRWVER